MKNKSLNRDYVERAGHRLAAVELLYQRKAFADVVREAQEVVELCLKALLRIGNVEVPHIHDVGDILLENRKCFPTAVQKHLERFAEISHDMRRDRELAFYGSEDFTPSEFYKEKDAKHSLQQAKFVYEGVRAVEP